MNGHHHHKILESGRFAGSASSGTKSTASISSGQASIASLCNLGNTCFLNSVLYTLRFTPGFLHNLHHLVADLGIGSNGNSSHKDKKKAGSNSNGNGITDAETELVHDVIEQLHDLFRNMSSCDDHLVERESSSSKDPIPPSSFLNAVGKMNSMFEGNQQQDAHELLIALLTMLRDIKIPPPAANSLEDDQLVPEVPAKKGDKKKSKKSFLTSNSNGLNISNSGSSNGGVKLISATPRLADSGPANNESSSQMLLHQSESMPNFVRDNFVGKTVFRTKCLECETCTFRSDKFINIDIPLLFDDDLSETMMSNGLVEDLGTRSSSNGSTLSVADLFLKQIMASETLRENNKYLCAECSRLNEAQRSVQYELLPKVLVLQLKRFTAASNKSAFMSKINDFIPTPFTMNCFCTQCMPPDTLPEQSLPQPKHHYRLFAVIMHLGATLASGHYIAYVRASVDLNGDYSLCPRASQLAACASTSDSRQKSSNGSSGSGLGSSSNSNGKKGIMKYFSRSSGGDSSKSNGVSSSSSSLVLTNGKESPMSSLTVVDGLNGGSSVSSVPINCRSANCCGMQRILCQLNNRDPPGVKHQQRSHESLDSTMNGEETTDSVVPNGGHMEDLWLECDDENISVITRRQFEDELNSKQSATTPYLLFYERV